MVQLGYAISSEEHLPNDIVRHARMAEEAGFGFSLISDHYHPWVDAQGQSPFVWSVIGGIAGATRNLALGTGVTCPTVRIHPAIIAQAAATSAAMMPGRFFLGIGSGENLNEHILGDAWPSAEVRLEMLEEAVEVMRKLWEGGYVRHRGEYFTVENARIYSLPEEPPPIYMAAAGERAAETAGRIADGFIGTSPQKDTVEAFERAGGGGKPKYGQLTVCWARTEEEATKTVLEIWPNAAIQGELGQELPLPRHFQQAAQMVKEQDLSSMPLGPDPERYVEAITQYAEAGYDHVYLHQVGQDQEGFFRFYETEVQPKIG